jgi:membrane protease YdiL (CAAX protease family)
MQRVMAILEVTIVTGLTWVAYKALKLIEPGGFGCSPGFAMIVVATGMLILRRRDFASYGVVSREGRRGLTLGVVIGFVLVLGDVILMTLVPIASGTPVSMPAHVYFGLRGTFVLACLGFVFLIVRRKWHRSVQHIPLACTLALLALLLLVPPVFAISTGAPLWQATGLAGSLVFFTGFGEELFFRGYVQSRLNGVFGRPWRFLGASLGPGVVITALLFGAIHIFNPTKPFEAHWELSWAWGAAAFVSGLLFGYLRELTGSIWAATVVHALTGEYRGLWQVFSLKP